MIDTLFGRVYGASKFPDATPRADKPSLVRVSDAKPEITTRRVPIGMEEVWPATATGSLLSLIVIVLYRPFLHNRLNPGRDRDRWKWNSPRREGTSATYARYIGSGAHLHTNRIKNSQFFLLLFFLFLLAQF